MGDIVTIITVLGASALSIGLLVALNAFLGGWTAARLPDLSTAAERISVDVLGFNISGEGVLDAEKRAALIVEQGGDRLGLAVCLGDKIAVRALRRGEVRSVNAHGGVLDLELDDYTLPHASLRLTDDTLADRWAEMLRGFVAQENGAASHA